MKGYKTILTMIMGLAFSLLSAQGWVIPESDQAAIMTGILAVAGIFWRFKTTGPVFDKAPGEKPSAES